MESLPVVGVGHHAHLALHGSNLLLRGRLRTTHSEEAHLGGCVKGGGMWLKKEVMFECCDLGAVFGFGDGFCLGSEGKFGLIADYVRCLLSIAACMS